MDSKTTQSETPCLAKACSDATSHVVLKTACCGQPVGA